MSPKLRADCHQLWRCPDNHFQCSSSSSPSNTYFTNNVYFDKLEDDSYYKLIDIPITECIPCLKLSFIFLSQIMLLNVCNSPPVLKMTTSSTNNLNKRNTAITFPVVYLRYNRRGVWVPGHGGGLCTFLLGHFDIYSLCTVTQSRLCGPCLHVRISCFVQV